jgi:uncharacterized protein involved in exopolysaccharide biosynthesis
MLDRLSIPRRALDFDDYMDMIRRNVRWIVGPVFAGLVVSTVVAYMMNDTFVSRAVIRIVPQQIPETLVQNASAQDISDRINGMAQSILSRPTLTALINTYGLYKTELKSEPMQDVIEKMKNQDISIRPQVGVTTVGGKGMTALDLSFQYRDRFLANKICGELVSKFMNAGATETLDSQVNGNQFIRDEYDRTKRELDAFEQRLADYRAKHAGSLPEQMNANFQEMAAVEQRLNSLSDSAGRNSEKRMMLEASLRITKDRIAANQAMPVVSAARSERTSEYDRQIADLESTIASLKDRYTDKNPDLQAAQDRLVVLKKQRDDAQKAAPKADAPAGENQFVARERLDAKAQIDSLESQLKITNVEEQKINQEIQSANAQLRALQARVDTAPMGEKEYGDLIRERDLARQKYIDLDSKLNRSNQSMDLERRKQGETLELLESASLPVEPTKPNRATIIPIGAVVGLVIGVVIVAVREVKDTSLKNLKDARLYTQLSILGSIPLLENDVVVQRRKQVMLIGWATATILGLAIIAGSVAHYYLNRA